MIRPTIYIHHDGYPNVGPHLTLINAQHRYDKYPKSVFGYFVFYQYLIEKDGKLIQTRPELDPDVVYKEAHKNSISVCIAGNLDHQVLTYSQKRTLSKLFKQFYIDHRTTALDIKEHRDYQDTSCPGKKVPKEYFARFYISTQLGYIKSILYSFLLKLQSMRK